jgi:hypothetical protein
LVGKVSPNIEKVLGRARRDNEAWQGSARRCRSVRSGLPLQRLDIEWPNDCARYAFPPRFTQALDVVDCGLALGLLHSAQRFADEVASRAVIPGGYFGRDEFCDVIGQGDAEIHA